MGGQCTSCHSGNNTSGGVDLSTHNGVVDAVNNDNLIAAIDRTGKPMPPAAAMADCDINKIKKWIADGMPNN
jgi:mono/diheme cytochrome c family protein